MGLRPRELSRYTPTEEIGDFNYEIGRKPISGLENLRPALENFSDIYSPEEIRADLDYVQKIEKIHKMNDFKNSGGNEEKAAEDQEKDHAAEYLTIEAIYEGNWLDRDGYEVFVKPTSKFDDYHRGIDLEVGFRRKDDENWIYLGIDVTTSQSARKVREKVKRTAEDIKIKGLSEIKYHQPDKKSEERKGRLQMPRVVVGYNQEELLELIRIHQGKVPGKTLEDNPLQVEFRQEILDQLIISLRYFIDAKNPQEGKSLIHSAEEALAIDLSTLPVDKRGAAVKIQEAIEFVQGVRQEKNPSEKISPERAMDPILQELAPFGTRQSLVD